MSVHRAGGAYYAPNSVFEPREGGQLLGGGVGPDADLPSRQLLLSFNTVQVVLHLSSDQGFSTDNPRQPGRYVRYFVGHNVERSCVFIYISGSTFIFNIFRVPWSFSDKKCGKPGVGLGDRSTLVLRSVSVKAMRFLSSQQIFRFSPALCRACCL
jgi:hypothetical protein